MTHEPVVWRELSTERLRLDAVTPGDTDAVLEYCNDPILQEFVPVPVPYTRETAEAYAVGYATDAPMLWAMRAHDDDLLLGVIELIPAPLASAELGYWLGAQHRGRGFMTEAMRTVVEFGLSVDGADLTRISWCAVVGNVASARAARSIGFRYEGLRRRSLPHREERLDGWFASLLRDDDRNAAPEPGWPV
jgi:RimJ/RimL family protein N-acetyltransferase